MAGFFSKLLSAGEGKQLKHFQALVVEINALEPTMQNMSDDDLLAQTNTLRSRYKAGESLEKLLPEAFATVREASVRVLEMRHFDVQLIGGMALNAGQIAEMKTGEGKTLVSTLAGYLNAIPETGVHIVTVNDYLARRDSEWMGRIYRFLGMNVGLIQAGMRPESKSPAYEADVTYGTNSEFGFDYLRDNMVSRPGDRVQKGHAYAIVDEVDSILIDEARTPLIISGAGTRAADTYNKFARAMSNMREGADFEKDEAKRTIFATEGGLHKIETLLGIDDLYGDPSGQLVNHLQQAMRAEFLFKKDVDYVVIDGEVKIVDEFTGRIMEGRRYSEGLHQALEAKERVLVREENQTLATITLQNYFRMYQKLSGMTGTAMTEDAEFRQIYKLPVMAIPSNRPAIREDKVDLVYRSVAAKYRAVAEDIAERHQAGQPSLVGTVSIENSEHLSRLLQRLGIPHEVLNAKHHEREAHIVAQAGRVGAVTIATNMAGRGTDILLGGNPEFLAEELLVNQGYDLEEMEDDERAGLLADALVKAKRVCADEHELVVKAGGLAVIGTERHESRRIDNQLRGRSGRQGDPGCTQFYLSLEDDLMRLFGGGRMDRIASLMERTDRDETVPIESGMVSKAIEGAQRQVEAMHFDSRKHVLEYDDVMNLQRDAIYKERNAILDGKDIHNRVLEIMDKTVERTMKSFCDGVIDDWDWNGLGKWLEELTGLEGFDPRTLIPDFNDEDAFAPALLEHLGTMFEKKEEAIGEEQLRRLEAQVMLRIMDTRWMNHMQEMDYLKAGIGLRAFGQRDPLTEYKNEAHAAFGELRDTMYEDYLRTILRIQIVIPEAQPAALVGAQYSGPSGDVPSLANEARSRAAQNSAQATHAGAQGAMLQPAQQAATQKTATIVKDKNDPFADVGRNDPCPCGSGLKYKRCHGANS
ncbi:MAG: preprotein translocase subunit SecA [Coriobacteriales bacterium]|jgi:preprotein translocase subunit SecA|nr:preprotein translocase subunit SecA [Coriobacteriales bacterium]